ncbi:D-aminoacyl-tRNA deacylase [Yaniella flava]|uniref:D-aminoacyl-tRNA deacylase n=1 Tax=Yaniella flava TaxID=287930 RepID=A0ABP5FUF1_9MICC|nr:D-tyrosyl-tRNA(Tyr) deacylase [Micrococcaceae bacterium]
MRAVIQVVTSASVTVDEKVVGELPRPGLMILLGVHVHDGEEQADVLVNKIVHLRILDDEQSAVDLNAPIMVVSQFTLNADVRKGRRPSWSKAARPEHSEPLYEYFVAKIREQGLEVVTGEFGAMMDVALVNSGPFTLVIDSDDLAAPRRGGSSG